MKTPTTPVRPGLALGTSQYELEANSYVQSRLRTFWGVAFALVSAMYVIGGFMLKSMERAWEGDLIWSGGRLVHLASAVISGVVYFALRRRSFGPRALLFFDALGLYVAVAATMSIYAIEYELGPVLMPAILALFVIARAVIVPCSAKATFLLSLPAPFTLLIINLAYGTAYSDVHQPMSQDRYIAMTMWNQVVVFAALAIAVVAAHVNFGLRRQAFEARRLGQYQLEQKIGEGGMGEVYRATHAMLRRPTAIKLLRPEITGEDTIRRFEREVRQTSRLSHPNTVSIYDYGRTPDGVFYYAMEFLDGEDLNSVVKRTGVMPAARVIHILMQACAGLAEAHSKNLVHRDIKPSNLMLCSYAGGQDVVKLVDFGLVRDLGDENASGLTRMGEICGTPETLSPEVLGGETASPRSDLYSLGAVGCFLLTGEQIFDAHSAAEFVGHHLHSDPTSPRQRNPDVPEDLEVILMSCLAKDPAQRPQDAIELRKALGACADAGAWTEEQAAAWWRKSAAAT